MKSIFIRTGAVVSEVLLLVSLIFFAVVMPVSVSAQGFPPPSSGGGSNPSSGGGSATGGSYAITNPLCSGGGGCINTVSDFIQALLRAVVAIGVPIAVLFIVLAGFKFITAQGNPEALSKARTNFLHVIFGVAIFIGAWALAQLITQTLRQIGVGV